MLLDHSQILKITGGQWFVPPLNLSETLWKGAFDTRSIDGAEIFFCWRGENSDGHQYAHHLSGTTVRLIIAEREIDKVPGVAILLVRDSLKALHQIAAALVRGFKGKIVNITGSSGKTTAKTWLYHLLKEKFNVLTNVGSFNNHIGCPITILSLRPEHNLLLLEMGTSGLGELELLVSIAPSDIAVLLNVGHAHIGKFGSLENTYKAKLEIFKNQRKGAVAIIPNDDAQARETLKAKETILFGATGTAFAYRRLETFPASMSQSIQFTTPWGTKEVNIPVMGSHVGQTLSALLAVCWSLNMDWLEIQGKLNALPSEKGRSTFIKTEGGALILDDTYNANPESVINMLRTICQLDQKRYVGIIGNLAELEDDLSQSAEYILENLPDKITDLFFTGDTGKILAPMVRERLSGVNTQFLDCLSELTPYFDEMSVPDIVIGVKGSRSAHMERVVYALLNQTVKCLKQPCFKLMMCRDCEELAR